MQRQEKIPDEQGFLLGVFFYNIMLRNEDRFIFGDLLELKIFFERVLFSMIRFPIDKI